MKTGRHASYPTLVDATSFTRFVIFQDVGYGSRACHCQTWVQSTVHTNKNITVASHSLWGGVDRGQHHMSDTLILNYPRIKPTTNYKQPHHTSNNVQIQKTSTQLNNNFNCSTSLQTQTFVGTQQESNHQVERDSHV